MKPATKGMKNPEEIECPKCGHLMEVLSFDFDVNWNCLMLFRCPECREEIYVKFKLVPVEWREA